MALETISNYATRGANPAYTTVTAIPGALAAIPGTLNGYVVSGLQSKNTFIFGAAKSVDLVAKTIFIKYALAAAFVFAGIWSGKTAFTKISSFRSELNSNTPPNTLAKAQRIAAIATLIILSVAFVVAAPALVILK